jgi:hypothetical protein
MDFDRDASTAVDLACYSIMRALLRTRYGAGVESARPDIQRVVADLEARFGRDRVMTLVGSLGLKALFAIEQDAKRFGHTAEKEIDAEEQRALAMFDEHNNQSD